MFAKFMSVIWYWSLSMLLKYLSLPWPPVEMALMGHSHLDNWGLLAQCLAFLILRTAFLSCHKPAMHLKWLRISLIWCVLKPVPLPVNLKKNGWQHILSYCQNVECTVWKHSYHQLFNNFWHVSWQRSTVPQPKYHWFCRLAWRCPQSLWSWQCEAMYASRQLAYS